MKFSRPNFFLFFFNTRIKFNIFWIIQNIIAAIFTIAIHIFLMQKQPLSFSLEAQELPIFTGIRFNMTFAKL